MPKSMYEDPKGMKICRKCKECKPLTSEFYSSSNRNRDGFLCYCKACDNAKRTERFKTKASHNIHRRCKMCDSFFYAELSRVNKKQGIFCSHSCKAKYQATQENSANFNYDKNGANNPNAKLTAKDINEIREAVNNDERYEDIARKYNISVSHISNIKFKRAWKKEFNHEQDANIQGFSRGKSERTTENI